MLYIPFPQADEALPQTRPLLLEGRGTVPAAPGTPVILARANLGGFRGFLTSYGLTVRSEPGYDWSGSLVFSLLVNDGVVPDNLATGSWTGQRGSVAVPMPTIIEIPQNATLTFLAQRAVAAAQPSTIDCIALGFMWPKAYTRVR